MSPEVAAALTTAGLDPARVDRLVRDALEEDLTEGGSAYSGVDVTSAATVPADAHGVGEFRARRAGTAAGVPVAAAAVESAAAYLGAEVTVALLVADGTRVSPGDVLLTASGPTRVLLTAERTALNLLCHLSGVATLTRAWADEVAGTRATVRDTRKTTPGLRALEKYAVRCGGGVNHRMGLSDAALVKDNHVLAAGGVREAFAAVRAAYPGLDVEVEVDTLAQLADVVDAGADLVLLDNLTVEQTREAVAITAGRARLESSGGLSLDVARVYAETGVDHLAVGALTHSAPVLDIGVDLRTET